MSEAVTRLIRQTVNMSIDVGTGFGVGTSTLLNIANYVITLDPNEGPVKKMCKASEEPRLDCIIAVAEAMPFRNCIADIALALFSAHHFSDHGKAVNNIVAVSKRAIIIDWTPETAGIYNPHTAEELRESMKKIVELVKRFDAKVLIKSNYYIVDIFAKCS